MFTYEEGAWGSLELYDNNGWWHCPVCFEELYPDDISSVCDHCDLYICMSCTNDNDDACLICITRTD